MPLVPRFCRLELVEHGLGGDVLRDRSRSRRAGVRWPFEERDQFPVIGRTIDLVEVEGF